MNGLQYFDKSQHGLHYDEAPDTAGIKKNPSVAIVILNWNGRKFLEQFLPSVLASVYDNKKIIYGASNLQKGLQAILK